MVRVIELSRETIESIEYERILGERRRVNSDILSNEELFLGEDDGHAGFVVMRGERGIKAIVLAEHRQISVYYEGFFPLALELAKTYEEVEGTNWMGLPRRRWEVRKKYP